MLTLLCASVGLLLASAAGALLSRRAAAASAIGACGAVAACGVALVAALQTLASGLPARLDIAWSVPYGSFSLLLDPLAAFFVVPVSVVSGLSAIYGHGYLEAARGGSIRAAWFWYDVLVAAMLLVLLARNGILFLAAWEAMALASFFLVTHEHHEERVRRAGLVYLVATHAGTALLLVLFLLGGRGQGTLDIARFTAPSGLSGLCFVLAVIGFGTKAGLAPVHVWLPEAHPVAPSHVSAVMSAAMIKLGIYGLLRFLPLLGPVAPWWGFTLVGLGAASALLGVLHAVAERDLKRLLAFSSVENAGIITLSIGLGVLGVAWRSPALAGLGLLGALLHVWSHAAFKSLLFLAAGAVLHATGTRSLDRLGGLLRRMPATGACALAGVVAICALPPGAGFASELCIYLAAFSGAGTFAGASSAPFLVAVGTLALAGGLALAAFAKAFGIAFLGEPRTEEAARAHEVSWSLRAPMAALAILSISLGVLGPLAARAAFVAIGGGRDGAPAWAVLATRALGYVGAGSLALALLTGAILALRSRLLRGRDVRAAVTWDCGYARPAATMQYTASSFGKPLTRLLRPILRTRRTVVLPDGPFPRSASLATSIPSPILDQVYLPAAGAASRALQRLRVIQSGRVQLYILYVAATMVALLLWFLP